MIALGAAMAIQSASGQAWRVQRRDGIETVAMTAPDGASVQFVCRRGGERPGTGSFQVRFPVGRDLPLPTPPANASLELSAGGQTVTVPVAATIARGERLALVPPRERGRRPAEAPGLWDIVTLTFAQSGSLDGADRLAAIATLFADRRVRQVDARVPILALSARFAGGATRELAGFARGCRDGLPEEDDEVQGAWHQGLSSSAGQTVVTLTVSVSKGEAGASRVKLALACDHGETSLRLSSPGRLQSVAFMAEFRTGERSISVPFVPGPAAEEATAAPTAVKDVIQLLLGAETATLKAAQLGINDTSLPFDVYGLDFALRGMRRLCPGL
jgi:hypothetical protein